MYKILFFILLISIVYSQGLKSPTDFDIPPLETEINSELSISVIPFTSIIKFYQGTLSQIKGENCQFYPTCSQYSIEALQQYGIKGVFIAADRLHRCGHDLQFYTKVIVNDKIKYLDMITENK